MDYIYTRAARVLIWLGASRNSMKNYGEYRIISGKETDIWCKEEFARWICRNQYWTRLWIIQEVALARDIHVYTGTEHYDWDEFMRLISITEAFKTHGSPLSNLQAKRRTRHHNSNRLETLLEDFQYVKCSELRDRIYGFLGLAHDVQDGSIQADYDISLYDLYMKVIQFLYTRRRYELNESQNAFDRSTNIVRLSALVQKLLQDIQLPRYDNSLPVKSMPKDLIRAHGFLVSRIFELGPTHREMVSSSAANKRWRFLFGRIQRLSESVRLLREANEAFSHILLGMTDGELAKVANIYPDTTFSRAITGDYPPIDDAEELYSNQQDHEMRESLEFLDEGSDVCAEDISSVIIPQPESLQPRMFAGDSQKAQDPVMGLAPPCAQKDDWICTFRDTHIAALLRLDLECSTTQYGPVYRIVGRLYLSTGSLQDLKPVYKPWNNPSYYARNVGIQMDIRTLALLTC